MASSEVDPIGAVLAIVRDLNAVFGPPTAAMFIRDEAHKRFGIRYDAVNRALRELVDTGLLVKPRRGFYAPVARSTGGASEGKAS